MALFSDGSSVGLLLTEEAIYAVEVSAGRGGDYRVLRRSRVSVPRGAYVGGSVVNTESLGQAVRELWREGGFTAKKVVLGLPASQCAWRRMDVPPVSREEQLMIVRNELEPEGLFDPSRHVMDILPLALPPGEDGAPVTVVTAEEIRVQSLREALQVANLTIEAVEPLPVSAVRLAATALEPGEAATVALVSRGMADLIIAEGGTVRFQRRIAGDWPPTAAPRPKFLGMETEQEEDPLAEALEENALALLAEVRRSVVFCQRLAPDTPAPHKIFLITEDAELDSFLLATAFATCPTPCGLLDTLTLPHFQATAQEQPAGKDISGYSLALGLALRRVSALSEGNRLDLSKGDDRMVLKRSGGEIRARVALLAGTWAVVNVALWFAVGGVIDRCQKTTDQWRQAAEAAAMPDPRLEHRDRAEHARNLSGPDDVRPERWLDLLGTISTPEIQMTGVQLNKGEINLSAQVGRAEAALPFSGSLEHFLPVEGSPTVAVAGEPGAKTSFNLAAKLRSASPMRPGEQKTGMPAAPSSPQVQPVRVTEVRSAINR
jgi:Tfp pilus assembly PilM family ATPase